LISSASAGRRAQGHRDVVGDLVAGDRDHGRVADRAVENTAMSVVPPPMSISTTPSSFSSAGQHRVGRRHRLQDQVRHFQAAAAHALDDVLHRGHRAGNDVHAHLEADAAHADRLAHVFLAVDDEFLRHRVQQLLVGRDVDRLGRLDHARHVGRGDFLVLDRHHAARIEAERIWLPAMPAYTLRILQSAISSASSSARWIDSTVASMLTTTPFFRPFDSCWPRPITSWRPSAITSATTATTFEVPMSRPTIRFFASFVILLSPA
jgi:hypothetical protein